MYFIKLGCQEYFKDICKRNWDPYITDEYIYIYVCVCVCVCSSSSSSSSSRKISKLKLQGNKK
jgi:hypothetical protein